MKESASDKYVKAQERKRRIEAGFFDGRFRPRRVKDKKKHTDKYKARKNAQNDGHFESKIVNI